MRTSQCVRAGSLMATVAACTLIGGAALAATTTERPGSILIFPKVVTTGTRDTVIQITNTGNMPDDLRCFYLNGTTCFQTDFAVSLTRQQPTYWTASGGRRVNPSDSVKGLDPGLIPPLPANFAGALICVEVDAGDKPIIRNQIKGEATIVDRSQSSTINAVGKYNAVAVQGIPSGNSDDTLKLDNSEYSACPAALVANFTHEGSDGVIEALGNGGRCVGGGTPGAACNNSSQCSGGTCLTGQSRVLTRITAVPCNLDFLSLTPADVVLTLLRHDEQETPLSGGIGFGCWGSFVVSDAFSGTDVGTPYAVTQMRSTAGGPVVGVAEVFFSDSVANTASAIVNLHTQGVCSLDPGNRYCNRDADCPPGTGTCQKTENATIQLSTP